MPSSYTRQSPMAGSSSSSYSSCGETLPYRGWGEELRGFTVRLWFRLWKWILREEERGR